MKFMHSHRFLSAFSMGLLAVLALANAADAFFVGGVTFGVPLYAPAPAYYYPPAPAYYYPPPAPAPVYAPAPVSQNVPPPNCHEFSRTVIINGQKQLAYGDACQQPDGKWKIVD
jgi:hypothetical protein